MRLSTRIYAAIAPLIALVIALIGYSYAQDPRGITATSRVNKETGSQDFRNERQTIQNVTRHSDSPYERKSTGCDAMSRVCLRSCKGEKSRVVGAKSVKIEEFPFMASLEKRRRHLCSLLIINERWLLTAGHCTIDILPENSDIVFAKPKVFSVSAGTPLITVNLTKKCIIDEVRRNVDRLVRHPKFRAPVFVRDLVLVHVPRSLPFSSRVKPAPLPKSPLDPQRHLITGRQCQVTGWGSPPVPSPSRNSLTTLAAMALIKEACRREINMDLLLVLQEVTLTVLSNKVCIKEHMWAQGLVIEKEHICAVPDEGQEECSGDSGAPLICDGTVVGLVSLGYNHENVSSPTIFTRIDTELDWISKTTAIGKANLPYPPTNVVVVVTLGQLAMAVSSICHA